MAFDGSGTFNRLYSWTDDAANGIKIRADRMDAEMDGFATGLSDCVTRDGQSPATADLPMGGFHHTNVADANGAAHYASAGQIIDDAMVFCTAAGNGTAVNLTSAVAPSALAAGQRVSWIAPANITGSVTVKRDGLTGKTLKIKGSGLSSGMIIGGDLCTAIYDGTQFNLLAPDRSIKPIAEGGTNATTAAAALTSLGAAASARTISAGTGLSGGGDLTANRTLSVSFGTNSTTAAVGNDSRITGALQKSNNLSDIPNITTAKGNLNIYTGANINITVSSSSPSGGSNGDLWFKT